MSWDRHEVQLVALTMADGSLAVMSFITRAWSSKAAPEGDSLYVRRATEDAIEREIARAAFAQPVVSWRRIEPGDLPETRDNRDAWRDEGNRIVIDPERIKVKSKTIEERLIAIEASTGLAEAADDTENAGPLRIL